MANFNKCRVMNTFLMFVRQDIKHVFKHNRSIKIYRRSRRSTAAKQLMFDILDMFTATRVNVFDIRFITKHSFGSYYVYF